MMDDPLAIGSLATATIAAGTIGWSLASAKARDAGRLGPRGLKRTRALANPWFAMVEPVLRWGGTRISGLLPDSLVRSLDGRLMRAGDYLGLTPEEYVVALVAGSVLGFACGWFHRHGGATDAAPFFACVVGFVAVQMHFDKQIATRVRELTNGLPYVIDLLSLSMSAGLDFPGAVRGVVERSSRKNDALTEELERVLQELSLGHTRRHALQQMSERTRAPSVVEFVNAVVQAERRGNPLVEVLSVQARVARDKRLALGEKNAARAEQAMIVPLLLLTASTAIVIAVPPLLTMMAAIERSLP
jgi:tight adherence protein C